MVQVERTFTVRVPLRAVVEYLADFAHAEAWDPGTKSCTRRGTGAVAVGAQWDNVSEFRGKETELEYTLVTFEPDRLVFEGTNKSATSTDDMSFAPDGDGTAVTYRATIEFHGIARLADPFLKGTFEKLADQTVTQMTTVLERLPDSG